MRKRVVNIFEFLYILGIVYADDLPIWLSSVAAAFCIVATFIMAPAGVELSRRHSVFGYQATELSLFMLIAVILTVAGTMTGPKLSFIFLLAVFCSGGCSVWLSSRRFCIRRLPTAKGSIESGRLTVDRLENEPDSTELQR